MKQKAMPREALGRSGGFAPVLVLVLVVVILGVGFFLVKQNNFVSQSSQPSFTPLASPIPTADPTANWKTYTDTRLHYSIQYPNDWNIKKVCLGGIVGDDYPCLESPDLVISPGQGIDSGKLIFIGGPGSSVFIDGNLTSDSYCKPQPFGGQIKSCASIAVGGKKSIERIWSDSTSVDVAIFDNNKITLAIRLETPTGKISPAVLSLFDQILSTFKFTN